MFLLGDHRNILRKSTEIWDNRENITVQQHTSGTNQEKGHSASLLSHAQSEQAGLDLNNLWRVNIIYLFQHTLVL